MTANPLNSHNLEKNEVWSVQYLYWITVSGDYENYKILHKKGCKLCSSSEDMIEIGRFEYDFMALDVARSNFQKVRPCIKCCISRPRKNQPGICRVPVRHFPGFAES